ncbi:deoxyguanosinetriphosphate triphosphohydrolase [Haliovirga abyssi]|uniref:Deoxyguanosinetriphosphate triphosphohydrolase-like protein n=1 Tax=Haliovirga abyssi TaxID=2996794 RepID=A0AAU9DDX3_9FUSO|nr:deoxyguanosinetriphosphate triphosphohydrolase [Haliovirga abyssi]BDU49507.1 deoxyguanosinetriphosphate triphosphohydrolase-like protein [Haliovirga abyssi]
MNIRTQYEELELKILSKYASKSKDCKGREKEEELCEIRTIYQQDRDRIIHSKSFRRLKHKTQVFISAYAGDHYRTRLTHTLEVSQIARTIARGLRLNEDLTEAIALGHDLGHTPFGHSGESILNKLASFGFKHNEQSLRVVEKLERKGKGLNLSFEVRNGILNHTGDITPQTLEGQIVKIADRMAYINHDIDDAIRAKLLKIDEIPKEYLDILGYKHSDRINTLVKDMIFSSYEKGEIAQSKTIKTAMLGLRSFLFSNFYLKDEIRGKFKKAEKIVELLYDYYMENPNKIEIGFEDGEIERKVVDYISGMTDIYAINKFKEIYLP